MSAYLSLTSHAPGAAELVLVDGPPYSPWVLVGKDIGNPTWQHAMSGPRGTQGRRPASGTPDDRRATFGLQSADQADKDALAATLSALTVVIDEMRRFGGTVTFREHAQTYRQSLEVMVGEITVTDWGSHRFELRDALRPALTFTCAPYVDGELMDIDEPFDAAAALEDFVAEAGSLADLTVSGGDLIATGALTSPSWWLPAFRLIHTGRGYVMGDQQVTIHGTVGSTVTEFVAGVVLKATDATNRLQCQVDDDGTDSWIRASGVVNGSFTSGATPLAARLVAGQEFWLRGTFANGRLLASFYGADPDGLDPDDPGEWAETTSTTYGVRGRAGVLWTPQHAAARIHRFTAEPFHSGRSRNVPTKVLVHRHDGAIPGDAPALCDVDMRFPAGGPTESQFGLFAWWRRPAAHNLIATGGFERASLWSAAAVTDFMGAATSVTRTASADAKFGAYVGVVVTPATANTGAHVTLSGQFMRGETYTARVWVRAPSSTTLVRARVGSPGPALVQSSTPVALSPTWSLHEVTWQPAIDTDTAHLGVEVTAATATTFHIDGACLYLGTTAPSAEHLAGEGGVPPFGIIEAENAVFSSTGGTAAIATDANASAGRIVQIPSVAALGETLFLRWDVDPSLVLPDDYAGQSIAVVGYARLYYHSALGSVKVYGFTAAGEYDNVDAYVAAAEFGRGEHDLVAGTTGWRLVRLGTLTIPVSSRRPTWTFNLFLQVGAGTNLQPLAVDYLALVPARGHVCSPTAKESDGYPTFLPELFPPIDGLPRRRVIYADGSSDLGAGMRPLLRSSGMNGVIEIPPGDVESLVLTAQEIPDDPAGAARATADEDLPYVHLRVRPRWSYLREAP